MRFLCRGMARHILALPNGTYHSQGCAADRTYTIVACRGSKLWIPAGTESAKNGDFVTQNFASIARTQIVYITRKDGGNVLTPTSLSRALSIHTRIIAASWPNLKPDGSPEAPDVPQPLKFTDVCLSTNTTEGVPSGDALGCTMSNPLALFSYNSTAWATAAVLLDTINTPALWNIALTGRGFVLDAVLGGLVRDEAGAVVSATTLGMFYMLAGNETLIEEQQEDVPAKAWEQEFLDILEVCPNSPPSPALSSHPACCSHVPTAPFVWKICYHLRL